MTTVVGQILNNSRALSGRLAFVDLRLGSPQDIVAPDAEGTGGAPDCKAQQPRELVEIVFKRRFQDRPGARGTEGVKPWARVGVADVVGAVKAACLGDVVSITGCWEGGAGEEGEAVGTEDVGHGRSESGGGGGCGGGGVGGDDGKGSQPQPGAPKLRSRVRAFRASAAPVVLVAWGSVSTGTFSPVYMHNEVAAHGVAPGAASASAAAAVGTEGAAQGAGGAPGVVGAAAAASAVGLCKFFISTTRCPKGDACKYVFFSSCPCSCVRLCWLLSFLPRRQQATFTGLQQAGF